MITVHNTDFKEDFKCQICQKTFSLQSSLKAHMKLHQTRKNFQCQMCEKVFLKKKNLGTHVTSVHNDENEFPCQECGQSFGSKNVLKQHMVQVHEERKDFKCDTQLFTDIITETTFSQENMEQTKQSPKIPNDPESHQGNYKGDLCLDIKSEIDIKEEILEVNEIIIYPEEFNIKVESEFTATEEITDPLA